MAAKDLYEKDFYKVLGVDKKADADEIKKRYRALARDLHPDKTKGDAVKEEQFKAVSEAYEILSDPKKRAEYDEARSLFARGGFRAPQGGGDFGDIFGSGNPQDIFANLFGAAAGRRGPRKGQDLQTEATISFRESVFGTTLDLRLGMDRGQSQNISARVPAGVNDGAKIRMKGKGSPGEAGPGDLFIQLHVKPHPIFGRKGENLTLTLPVTFAEAALGADIKVPGIFRFIIKYVSPIFLIVVFVGAIPSILENATKATSVYGWTARFLLVGLFVLVAILVYIAKKRQGSNPYPESND